MPQEPIARLTNGTTIGHDAAHLWNRTSSTSLSAWHTVEIASAGTSPIDDSQAALLAIRKIIARKKALLIEDLHIQATCPCPHLLPS
jgi:hypothetical protein